MLDPPLRRLGVFDLDTFIGPDDRRALAMRLNTLVASPSFAAWLDGTALSARDLLHTTDGRPRASVVSIAHLSDEQRQAVVSLLLGRLITWMRGQAGTGSLRALVYIDEVFGLVPPTAAPPSKAPILTLLKQARAYGAGTVLATQNPVDLDYKAMSNAATWVVGRLQTERDKARIVEGLQSARGDVDVADLDRRISGLDPRQFIVHSTHLPAPVELTSRWAMSYLAGPLTGAQLRMLTADDPARGVPTGSTAAAVDAAAAEPDDAVVTRRDPSAQAAHAPPTASPDQLPQDATAVMPPVADGTPARWLDPAAPWGDEVGVAPDGPVCEAAAARVAVRYDDRAADIDHRDEWEAVWFPVTERLDPADAITVDHDDRDLRDRAPAGVGYRIPDAPVHTRTWWRDVARDLADHLRRDERISVWRNRELKLYARVGETRDAFLARCDAAAQAEADAETARLTETWRRKEKSLTDRLTRARQRVDQLEVDESTRRRGELLAGAGQLLSAVFGGGRSTRSTVSGLGCALGGMASRRGTVARTTQRREAAEERAAQVADDIEELEQRLAEQLVEIDGRWQEVAADIEEVEVGLERDDIDVTDVVLVWVRRDV